MLDNRSPTASWSLSRVPKPLYSVERCFSDMAIVTCLPYCVNGFGAAWCRPPNCGTEEFGVSSLGGAHRGARLDTLLQDPPASQSTA